MKKRIAVIVILIILIILGLLSMRKDSVIPNKKMDTNAAFNVHLLRKVNGLYRDNYLISPYSIKVALSMLKEGANGNTLNEIDNLLKDTNVNDISNENIGVANAVFIKNQYKDYIEKDFQKALVSKYASEVLYDEFVTPDVINNWTDEKTNHMIPSLLDDISRDFVLGLANALAIDVKWDNEFDCSKTFSEDFKNGSKVIKAEMMHAEYEDSRFRYFENSDAKGIILPYRGDENSNLEFVGILPNDSIDNYINDMTLDSIDSNVTEASDKVHIYLSLPRFSYGFEMKKKEFISVLNSLGIRDAFDSHNADFTKIMSRVNMINTDVVNLYVAEAIHKTKIELNESGTKAAAVTYFGLDKATSFQDNSKVIDIKFDKPFIYLIRDKKTHEVLFEGVVYEPNTWNGSTCTN